MIRAILHIKNNKVFKLLFKNYFLYAKKDIVSTLLHDDSLDYYTVITILNYCMSLKLLREYRYVPKEDRNVFSKEKEPFLIENDDVSYYYHFNYDNNTYKHIYFLDGSTCTEKTNEAIENAYRAEDIVYSKRAFFSLTLGFSIPL